MCTEPPLPHVGSVTETNRSGEEGLGYHRRCYCTTARVAGEGRQHQLMLQRPSSKERLLRRCTRIPAPPPTQCQRRVPLLPQRCWGHGPGTTSPSKASAGPARLSIYSPSRNLSPTNNRNTNLGFVLRGAAATVFIVGVGGCNKRREEEPSYSPSVEIRKPFAMQCHPRVTNFSREVTATTNYNATGNGRGGIPRPLTPAQHHQSQAWSPATDVTEVL